MSAEPKAKAANSNRKKIAAKSSFSIQSKTLRPIHPDEIKPEIQRSLDLAKAVPCTEKERGKGKGKGKSGGNIEQARADVREGKGEYRNGTVDVPPLRSLGSPRLKKLAPAAQPPEDAPTHLYTAGVLARDAGNDVEARRLFALAAKKQHPKAMHNLAVLTEGDDPDGAIALFRQAAFKGMSESQYALGRHLLARRCHRGGAGSSGEASTPTRSRQGGADPSEYPQHQQEEPGSHRHHCASPNKNEDKNEEETGEPKAVDTEEACAHLRRACVAGHLKAHLLLAGLLAVGGCGVTPDGGPNVQQAKELYEVVARSVTTTPLPSPPVDNPARTTNTSSSSSSSSSILSVSSASLNKSGKTCGGGTSSFPSPPSAAPPVATSPCEVKSMHTHSASHLANRACVHLGRLLEQETDGATSGGDTHAQALAWYLQASDRGDPTAAFNLSMAHCSETKAAFYLELAASRGHPKAMYNLACRKLKGAVSFYQGELGSSSGTGKPGLQSAAAERKCVDMEGAMALLRKAASQGLGKAAKALKALERQKQAKAYDEGRRRSREAAAENMDTEGVSQALRSQLAALEESKARRERAEAAAARALSAASFVAGKPGGTTHAHSRGDTGGGGGGLAQCTEEEAGSMQRGLPS